MSVAKLKAGTLAPVHASTFFHAVCPRVLAARADVCQRIGGRFAFSLSGDGGGAWTIDLTRAVVEPGAGPAEVRIDMAAVDFDGWLSGKLDVVAAAGAGRIHIHGDARLLPGLVTVLRPRDA